MTAKELLLYLLRLDGDLSEIDVVIKDNNYHMLNANTYIPPEKMTEYRFIPDDCSIYLDENRDLIFDISNDRE